MNIEDPVDRDMGCVSDLLLDRLLAGEIEGTSQGAQVTAHLAACPRCSARRAAFVADAAAFPGELIAEGLAGAARTPRRERPELLVGEALSPNEPAFRPPSPRGQRVPRAALPGRSRRLLAMGLAAAAALVLVLFVPRDDAGLRSKGGGALEIIAKTQDGVTRVLPGDRLAPGDAIRFEVDLRTPAWLAIVGLDSAQVVSPYVDGTDLPAGASQILPGSIVLDGTLGAERIVALFCEERIPTGQLLDAGRHALRAAGGDPAAVGELAIRGCAQSTVLIEKVARP